MALHYELKVTNKVISSEATYIVPSHPLEHSSRQYRYLAYGVVTL